MSSIYPWIHYKRVRYKLATLFFELDISIFVARFDVLNKWQWNISRISIAEMMQQLIARHLKIMKSFNRFYRVFEKQFQDISAVISLC